MSKHKQPGGIWTAQYAHCALEHFATAWDKLDFLHLYQIHCRPPILNISE